MLNNLSGNYPPNEVAYGSRTLRNLFAEAIEVSPVDRVGWLEQSCAQNPELAEELLFIAEVCRCRRSFFGGIGFSIWSGRI